MVPSIFLFAAFFSSAPQSVPQATPPTAAHHEANFESERTQANALFIAQKPLEAMPLYEDLCRQDPAVAVFAERYGAGLIAKEATITDAKEKFEVRIKAMNELRRAQSLGDNSAYVRAALYADSKTLAGATMIGLPLTVGYTYQGKPEAQAAYQQAETAFG
ncbi:hypothetical protein [Terracidiphilus sp.]|jgi:hypothetical protein|uniref:hypothetical protein n=1 Tax=Terracidiphilus sp. TaxID=1964191 RepID=UPI003C155FE0